MKTSDIVWQDTQHQELLDIIEELKTSPEAGAQLVEKLTDYIAHHFSLEEKYMVLTGYPNTKKHIRQHRLFEEKVEKLSLSKHIVEQGFHDEGFREHITEFLGEWLIDHLMGIDKDLEAHIMKSNIK